MFAVHESAGSNDVIIAGMVLFGTIATALVTVLGNRKGRKRNKETQKQIISRVEEGNEAIRTNHGKTPAEYLEMIGEVKDRLHGVESGVDGLVGASEAMLTLLAEHTESDASNFNEIRRYLHITAAADTARETDA